MTITDSARRLALVAVVAMLAALLPMSGAFAQDPAPGDEIVLDLDGENAVEYALRWSQVVYDADSLEGEGAPDTALLGRDDIFADSLASGVLQGASDSGSPLLLTPSEALSEDTAAELERLGVENVTVLGLEAAISEDVEAELEELGYTVDRQGGQTRIETAIDIAEDIDSDTALLARAFGTDEETQAFADSLAAGGWAAEDGAPVLLTETEVLTGNTAAHLEEAGYTNIIIIGGEAAVSADVEEAAGEFADNVTRVGGGTRFETAVAIAEARGYASPADAVGVILVDGQVDDAWADGFPAANLSGRGWPIVLSNSASDGLPEPTVTWLEGGDAEFAQIDENVVGICGSTVPDDAEATAGDQCGEFADILGATVVDFVPPTDPGGGLTDGRVTIDQASAPAGGVITGTIADAGDVQSVSVSGCGFSNENVTIAGDGTFSLNIPAGQAPGACTLTFNILLTDGTSETATINFTVTAAAATTTGGPDLLSASVSGNVVTYQFDEPVQFSVLAGPGGEETDFRIYNAAGTRNTATDLTLSADSTSVLAQFPAGTAGSATLATVSIAAVQDAAGTLNYSAGTPVGSGASQPGITSGPDLQVFSNVRISGTAIVADYRFDEPVDPTMITATSFFAYASDGTRVPGGAVQNVSADNRTVSMALTIPLTTPIGSIVRGGVTTFPTNAVVDPSNNPNVVSTEPRSGQPPFVTGVTADRTTDPDLVSVTVVGTNTVAYKFDETIQEFLFDLTDFFVYNAGGTQTSAAGGSAVRSPSDLTVVNVTFPAGIVGNAVGAFVEPGAVVASDDGMTNTEHELPLQLVASTAGRTAIPDLVSVTPTSDAFNVTTVDFTFDQALAPNPPSDSSLFQLVNAQGVVFIPGGVGCTITSRDSGRTVRLVNCYTPAQVADTVLGAVEDNFNNPPPLAPATDVPEYTEGDVPVTR